MARTGTSNYTESMEAGNFWFEETPLGAINGVNKTFTLSGIPNPTSSVELEVNGQTVVLGADYTVSGDTITTTFAYPTGTVLMVRFRVEPS